ncbi:MAG: PilT/PilU family type 4a pilus ATPase [Myxococcales bacterium]|nr:PilT/PilU family type 4a pilus ATPase [Myxococcales bacterium]
MEPQTEGGLTPDKVHSLLQLAVKRQASDVHFEVGYPPTYRVFGDLLPLKHPPLTSSDTESVVALVLKHAGEGSVEFFREGDRSYSLPGVSRFRATLFKQRGTWGAVMRLIPFAVPNFQQLGLPSVVQTVCGARRGLVLVTGATGNGKSTTIAAMLNHIILQERLHAVTVEDPIEFLFPSNAKGMVIQREVGTDTPSYSEALRMALRQDPDVIMVGELRDRDTADTCLKASETGHLVLTSLHTPDVARSIGRLVGMFPAGEQDTVRSRLAENLQAVLSLRLLTRADGSGLVPAVEALLTTSTVRQMVREGKTDEIHKYMETAGADLGMHSFDQYLYRLHESKLITLDAALANATNRADLERRLMIETAGPAV